MQQKRLTIEYWYVGAECHPVPSSSRGYLRSQGCDRHQFNTRHCEAKYYEYFTRVKEELESEFPDIVVSAKTGKPRVGAFEVRYSDAVRPARHQSSWSAWSLRGLGGF
jgi:hypothetical protein